MNKKIGINILLISFLLLGFQTLAQKTKIGKASFYANKFEGRKTASGEVFSQRKMTAAHRTLPFGTILKVTNLANGKSVKVKVNDRGPFSRNRLIDLSRKAAKKLDFIKAGVATVKIEIISSESDNKPTPVEEEETPSKDDTEDIDFAEYYTMNLGVFQPHGFAIQLESYTDAQNVFERCFQIKKATGKEVIVQIKKEDIQTIYRILIGPFPDRNSATKFMKKIASEYSGCFVKAFE